MGYYSPVKMSELQLFIFTSINLTKTIMINETFCRTHTIMVVFISGFKSCE